MEAVKSEIQWAIDVFNKYGIQTKIFKDKIVISNYNQPKNTTFSELGIDENELIKNVSICEGCFDTRKSNLTTFPLIAAREIRLYDDTKIVQMPELKAVGLLVCNKTLKKLPKLKRAISINMDESAIKTLPKLVEIDTLIAQNSKLEELNNLEKANKICIIDCPIKDLKSLKQVQSLFICSSDENNKNQILTLNNLEEVDKIFVANSELKSLPELKKANKIGLYNTNVKSIKKSIKAEIEINSKISDDELSEKFDGFTNWYNSDILEKSMDLLGEVVNKIKS